MCRSAASTSGGSSSAMGRLPMAGSKSLSSNARCRFAWCALQPGAWSANHFSAMSLRYVGKGIVLLLLALPTPLLQRVFPARLLRLDVSGLGTRILEAYMGVNAKRHARRRAADAHRQKPAFVAGAGHLQIQPPPSLKGICFFPSGHLALRHCLSVSLGILGVFLHLAKQQKAACHREF